MAETFALGVVFKAPLFLKYRPLDGIARATPSRWDAQLFDKEMITRIWAWREFRGSTSN